MAETNPMARAAHNGLTRRRTAGESTGTGPQRKITSDLMVEIDAGRHRELKSTAALNGTTVAAIVRGLISEYLDDQDLKDLVNSKYIVS